MKGSEVFRNQSVFVTGHTGFNGSWLALWLHKLGARVSGYSLPPPSAPSNFCTSEVKALLENHVSADIRNFSELRASVNACRPAVVFHLAAQTQVREGFLDPRLAFEVNTMGTVNVLEAVRCLERACVVVLVTGDKCYDNREPLRRYRETDPLGGADPHSASKSTAEFVAASYRSTYFPADRVRAHGVKVATVRTGNAVGGGDWAADRIVPDTVRAAVAHQPVGLRNPSAIRPWQHVLEPLSGYLQLAARMLASADPTLCSAWNFGPNAGEEATVRDLAELILAGWKGVRWEDLSATVLPREARVMRLCNDKSRAGLGWQPRWNLRETVRRTVRWYQQFYASPERSTRGLCLEDIRDYETLLWNEHKSPQKELVLALGK